jgi:hypothetical protein
MSRMSKGRGAGFERAVGAQRDGAMEIPSQRKRRAAPSTHQEPFVRAFVDALRDILVDEMRVVG